MGNVRKPVLFNYQKDNKIFSDSFGNDYKSISTSKRKSDSGKFLDEIGNALSEIWHGFAEFIAKFTKIWGIVKVKDPSTEKTHNYVVNKKILKKFNESSDIETTTKPKRKQIALKIFEIISKEKKLNEKLLKHNILPRNKFENLINFANDENIKLKLYKDEGFFNKLINSLKNYESEIDNLYNKISDFEYDFSLKKGQLYRLEENFNKAETSVGLEFNNAINEQRKLIEEYDKLNEQLEKTSKEIVEAQINEYYSKVNKLAAEISDSEDEIVSLSNLILTKEEVSSLKKETDKLFTEMVNLSTKIESPSITSDERLQILSEMKQVEEIYKPKQQKLESHNNKEELIKKLNEKLYGLKKELKILNSENQINEIALLEKYKVAFENQKERTIKFDQANESLEELTKKRTKRIQEVKDELTKEITELKTTLEETNNTQKAEISKKTEKVLTLHDSLYKLL